MYKLPRYTHIFACYRNELYLYIYTCTSFILQANICIGWWA